MPRVLIVNSNSSPGATEQIEAGCRDRLSPGTEVTYMTAEAGPEGIDTPLDIAISGLETARLILRHAEEFDAFVVACGNDPGLDIARQITDKPVVGIGEAGMLFALTLGAKFSALTLLRSETPVMEEMVQRYGLLSRLASVATLDISAGELIGNPDELYDRFVEVATEARDRDMAEVIVLVGSVMAGLEVKLSADVGIPVVSGMVCAIKLADDLAELGLRTSHAYKFRTPPKFDRLVGHEDFQGAYGAPDPVPVTKRSAR